MQSYLRRSKRDCLHCSGRLRPWHSQFCSEDCYQAGYEAAWRERFWSKVDKSGECWLWIGGLYKQTGYGQFGRCVSGVSSNLYAHRVSYEMAYGPIPEGLLVLHSCDVRACVRPEHLSADTQLQNVHDAIARGRFRRIPAAAKRQPTYAERARGERSGMTKLTEADVLEIRRLYALGNVSQRDLAKQFGVHQGNIHRIISGKNWRHI